MNKYINKETHLIHEYIYTVYIIHINYLNARTMFVQEFGLRCPVSTIGLCSSA
jgi:hypothetical protein